MTTAYATHQRFPEHDLPGHPEHAGRIQAVWRALDETGLVQRLDTLPVEPATDEHILTVHTLEYLRLFRKLAALSTTALIGSDTYVTPTSADVARLAAGAVIAVTDAILRGSAHNGLAAIRPPGHHAEPGTPMGFCLLGNVAIGARYAQQHYGVDKVLIVDYDVHHGNGTEAAFYEDPSVLFISLHQADNGFGGRFYPGTGSIGDIGAGSGLGYTLNIPIAAGHGDQSYLTLFAEVVMPAARRFKPQLILVSAGFDAHWLDPLGGIKLTLSAYSAMTRALIEVASEVCDGRIAFVMEGGYHLDALSIGVANIARLLLGESETADPLGKPTSSASYEIAPLLTQLRTLHKL